MEKLSGVFCAFWTATGAEGEILRPVFEKHLEFVLRAGIRGVMALGSTAEFPHFSSKERKQILEGIIRVSSAHGNRPVIANVSHVSFRRAVDLALHARDAGVVAVAVLPPWFYPAEPRDLAEFFVEIHRACGLPLLLYNYPEVSGKRIELHTIQQVAEAVPVLAVKQSGADFEYHHELLRLSRKLGFSVLTGADTRLREALSLGCSGTVSGLANAVPEALVKVFESFSSSEHSNPEDQLLTQLARELSSLPFPLNVKAAIAARGFETGAPKNPVSRETSRAYDLTVTRIADLYRDRLGASAVG